MNYFTELIKKTYTDIRLDIYVDMDGVIADYDFGNLNFKNKRPIKTNIKTLEGLSSLPNVTLYILSIGKQEIDIKEKNKWLDTHAPFFKKENRYIIIKEKESNLSSKELKSNFFTKIPQNSTKIILIDDDNTILKYLHEHNPNIILYQDSSIIP